MINRRKLIICILILGFILMISYGVTYARYASNSIWNYYLESKGFYFTSETLENKRINNEWDGSKVYFDVRNSINSYIATEYDINYEITCNIKNDVDGMCKINGTELNTFQGTLATYEGCVNLKDDKDVSSYNKETCNSEGYSYRVKESVANNYFEIVSNNNEELNNITVEIIVKSTTPYTKTIQNEFILSRSLDETGSLNLIYNEYEEYSNLIISNSYSEKKCIQLSFDAAKFRINNSSDVISYSVNDDGYINSVKLSVDSKTNIKHEFHRLNKKTNYNENDFLMVETECQ